jgi:hypothetical protein
MQPDSCLTGFGGTTSGLFAMNYYRITINAETAKSAERSIFSW